MRMLSTETVSQMQSELGELEKKKIDLVDTKTRIQVLEDQMSQLELAIDSFKLQKSKLEEDEKTSAEINRLKKRLDNEERFVATQKGNLVAAQSKIEGDRDMLRECGSSMRRSTALRSRFG